MFKGKTLLITGGTGTFGNAVLKRFLKTEIKEIRIFSRDEKKQEDQRLFYKSPQVEILHRRCARPDSLAAAMNGVDYVFHAAALKQVPSCEFFPMEALRTNTIGAENVLTAAVAKGVKKAIILSTDKAVYPINAMGLSKAMMEKIMIAKAQQIGESGTVLCGTRYGNVMASRGSVIPLFIELIKAGKPLTVTDPEMTRFMMSIDDAVDLVLYAFNHGKPGDMFVQKSPAATIETLAQALKKIFKADNPIKVIGTRHGEKRHETLLTREEMAKAEDLGGYYRIPADMRGLNYNLYFSEGEKKIALLEDYNSSNTRRLDVDGMAELLLDPGYRQGGIERMAKHENNDRSRNPARDHPPEPRDREAGQIVRSCPGAYRPELRPQPQRHLFR